MVCVKGEDEPCPVTDFRITWCPESCEFNKVISKKQKWRVKTVAKDGATWITETDDPPHIMGEQPDGSFVKEISGFPEGDAPAVNPELFVKSIEIVAENAASKAREKDNLIATDLEMQIGCSDMLWNDGDEKFKPEAYTELREACRTAAESLRSRGEHERHYRGHRPHPSPRPPCEECMYQARIDAAARKAREEAISESCRCDLYDLATGAIEAEDVRKCAGESCNWCGRYNESLRKKSEGE